MHRALASVIFAGLIASAHGHPLNPPSIVKTDAATHVKLQPGSEVIKVRMPRETPAAVVKEHATPEKSGWSKYGMMLATLIVMGAIVVRRQRLGRP